MHKLTFTHLTTISALLLLATIGMTVAQPASSSDAIKPSYNMAYQSAIRKLYLKDQAIENASYKSVAAKDQALDELFDEENKALKQLVRTYGWPTYTMVGREISDAAFVLILHQGDDRAFQKRVLKETLPLVNKREMSAYWYAYLYDRVAVNDGQKQLFGTQGHCVSTGPTGRWQPFPVNDATSLAERRSKRGMEPESQYIRYNSTHLCQHYLHNSVN